MKKSLYNILYIELNRIEGVKRSEGIVCPKGVAHSLKATLRTQSAYRSFASFRGEVADDYSRLGDCSIIEPSLLHPFAEQCGLDVPTVPRYDCTLPLTIPNDAKEACTFNFPLCSLSQFACLGQQKREPHHRDYSLALSFQRGFTSLYKFINTPVVCCKVKQLLYVLQIHLLMNVKFIRAKTARNPCSKKWDFTNYLFINQRVALFRISRVAKRLYNTLILNKLQGCLQMPCNRDFLTLVKY